MDRWCSDGHRVGAGRVGWGVGSDVPGIGKRAQGVVVDGEHRLNAALGVAWNLAGGYQRDNHGSIQPVLAIHDNTLRAFANTWNIGADAPTDPARANAMAA